MKEIQIKVYDPEDELIYEYGIKTRHVCDDALGRIILSWVVQGCRVVVTEVTI
jgi:hypothetical protein